MSAEQDAWLDVCLSDDFDAIDPAPRFCQADDCVQKATEMVEDELGQRRVMCFDHATEALMDGCEAYAR